MSLGYTCVRQLLESKVLCVDRLRGEFMCTLFDEILYCRAFVAVTESGFE